MGRLPIPLSTRSPFRSPRSPRIALFPNVFSPRRVVAWCLFSVLLTATNRNAVTAQGPLNAKHDDPTDKFAAIDHWLPTPSDRRTAAGDAGPDYWQQRADYVIRAQLNDQNQSLRGQLELTYHNRSPHELSYLWMQLDQNHFRPDSETVTSARSPNLDEKIDFKVLQSIIERSSFDGGYKLRKVTDGDGKPLRYVVQKTMMRIDLTEPLPPGETTVVHIDYEFNIVDATKIRARSGYEYFEEDKNYLYEMAQWFPRIAAYTDYQGWQNKQFLGRGEFTLELGDYEVYLTVPNDMVVAATGVLQNPRDCLSESQRQRLVSAADSDVPVYIITPDEALANQSHDEPKSDNQGDKADTDKRPSKSRERTTETKTWHYVAKNVRDFAFAASRKFAWDAMGVDVGDRRVMAMSYFPIEGNPLWHQYSTEAIVHTIEVYDQYTFEYPYPVAISVNGPVYGMEYPMICFNGPRPEEDGTYSKKTKYSLISVIIHEVGHNYFPMIVNSDERKWTWMDEGLNTFLQYLTEQQWEADYPSRRGDPAKIVDYMKGGNQRPIMTGSEQILQFGNNAYGKPATALNILRETIMGREAFDFAFKQFATRWRFKRPTPSDFFRTMEDASAIDLDWFWRGWFYSTDHVDIAVTDVKLSTIDSGDPDVAADRSRRERQEEKPTISDQRNETLPRRIDLQPGLKDFYNSADYDPDAVDDQSRQEYKEILESLETNERSLLSRSSQFYRVTFENRGGLVMPIIVNLHFDDGSQKLHRLPAEIWRQNSRRVTKLFITDKSIQRIEIDPMAETADTDLSNNHWPPKIVPSRFKLFKDKKEDNEMQEFQKSR